MQQVVCQLLPQARDRIKALVMLAVDEVSSGASDQIMATLDQLFHLVRGSDEPYGGVQLTLLGDLKQKAPSGNRKRVQDGHPYKTAARQVGYCFEARCWSRLILIHLCVRSSYRPAR